MFQVKAMVVTTPLDSRKRSKVKEPRGGMANVRIMLSSRLAGWRDITVPSEQLMRHLSSSSACLRSSLSTGENYQVVAADQKTIVCYHSPKPVPLSDSKPLRKRKVWENTRRLTDEEVTLVRKLRQEDGFIWSVATLARLFQTSPTVISRVAQASEERHKQLEEEREVLAKMRPHKRKLYVLQRQATRQSKLKELIGANKYSFPATKSEPN